VGSTGLTVASSEDRLIRPVLVLCREGEDHGLVAQDFVKHCKSVDTALFAIVEMQGLEPRREFTLPVPNFIPKRVAK
jgi:hypothetical protein